MHLQVLYIATRNRSTWHVCVCGRGVTSQLHTRVYDLHSGKSVTQKNEHIWLVSQIWSQRKILVPKTGWMGGDWRNLHNEEFRDFVFLTKYRVHINYRRISLRHNLSTKCRKIVKFMSITHNERDNWYGPIVATEGLHKWTPVPGRWVGRAAATDNTFCTWPPRSPDLTVCDFFLWGFVQGQCLRHTTSKDITRIARAHQHRNRERHTRHAWEGLVGNGSLAWTSAVSHVGLTSNAFNTLRTGDADLRF